mmetsp:Transcript_17803/g.25156  ORF Transcript_17803/g.25156 Transcript_17803/m.25156 type:complete len:125 (+) Transcript_17803:183-557(+)
MIIRAPSFDDSSSDDSTTIYSCCSSRQWNSPGLDIRRNSTHDSVCYFSESEDELSVEGSVERIVLSVESPSEFDDLTYSDVDDEDSLLGVDISLSVASVPPLRRSTRCRKRPVRFMDEYAKYYC